MADSRNFLVLMLSALLVLAMAGNASAVLTYQENANTTSYSGNWINPSYVYDGDWDTYGSAGIGGCAGGTQEGIYYADYNMTTSTVSGMTWNVKDDGGTTNYTIPESCIDYYADHVSFYLNDIHGLNEGFLYTSIGKYCYDGSWHELVYDTYTSEGENCKPNVYEEAIYFNVTEEEPPPVAPVVTIFSPSNETYNTTSIALDVSSDIPADPWYYDIGTGNVSFIPNTSVSIANGVYSLIVYAQGTGGWGYAEVETFTVNYVPPAPITGNVPLASGTLLSMLMGAAVIMATLTAGAFASKDMDVRTLVLLFVMMLVGLSMAVTLSGIN